MRKGPPTSKVLLVCQVVATLVISALLYPTGVSKANRKVDSPHWIGTWATAAQPAGPTVQTYGNQTLRLIVHTSIGGSKLRIKISNTYGDRPLLIGAAHIERRTSGADIDPTSDRT